MYRFVLIFALVTTFTTAQDSYPEIDENLDWSNNEINDLPFRETDLSDIFNNFNIGYDVPVPDGSMFNEAGPEEITCDLTSTPPSPRSKCCGVDALSNDRIVGGNRTEIEQHPWLAQIEYHNKNNNEFKRLCGGFLISARYVLSAAHCFAGQVVKENTAVNVILGEYNTDNEGPDCVENQNGVIGCTDGAITVPIERYRIHPKYLYDSVQNLNDIAIVKLSGNVKFTIFIRPICLPTTDVSVAPPTSLRFTTAGWGAMQSLILTDRTGKSKSRHVFDEVKRHVDVPFVNNLKCREQYRFVTPNHICAGGGRGKDSCKGDSGGPLINQKDGISEVVGIVSTASAKYPCGTDGRMAVYTNVYRYISWIREMIQFFDSK